MDRELSGIYFRVGNKSVDWCDMKHDEMLALINDGNGMDWYRVCNRLTDVLSEIGKSCNLAEVTNEVLEIYRDNCKATAQKNVGFYDAWAYALGRKIKAIGDKYDVVIKHDEVNI